MHGTAVNRKLVLDIRKERDSGQWAELSSRSCKGVSLFF